MNKVNNEIVKNFTTIPNEIIRDNRISDRARFLFCYMASMADNWQFYQSVMAKELGYSTDTLRKYIDELIESGYLEREQRREKGKFDSYDYTINYQPYGKNTDTVKNRHGKIPSRENSAIRNNNLEEKQLYKNTNLEESENKFSENEEINLQTSFTKINPFTVISEVDKEKEKSCVKKEKESSDTDFIPIEEKPEPKPKVVSLIYQAFTVYAQEFERLSGARYPADKNGNYIMNAKDAGQMVNLMKFLEKVDRGGSTIEALKVFINAAWNLNDKFIRNNFTVSFLYSQSSKIFMAYQTSSPAAKEKLYNERVDELLAEKMKKYQGQ